MTGSRSARSARSSASSAPGRGSIARPRSDGRWLPARPEPLRHSAARSGPRLTPQGDLLRCRRLRPARTPRRSAPAPRTRRFEQPPARPVRRDERRLLSRRPRHVDALYDGTAQGFIYARDGHPNAAQLAGKLARLEGGEAGLICASGHGRDRRRAALAPRPGRPRGALGGGLRQHQLPGCQAIAAMGDRPCDLRPGRRRLGPGRPHAHDAALFAETISNPLAASRRPPRAGRGRARGRHPADRRQHLRPPDLPADRARGQPRHALGDQDDRRP